MRKSKIRIECREQAGRPSAKEEVSEEMGGKEWG